MASETIEIIYQCKVAKFVTFLCTATSLIWLIMPIFSAFTLLTIAPFMIFESLHQPLNLIGSLLAYIGFLLFCLGVGIIASDQRIVASEIGLQMPYILTLSNGFNKTVLWSSVREMVVRGNSNTPYKQWQIEIITREGKNYRIALVALEPHDTEKLLLAAEVWLPQECFIPLIESVQQKFASLILPGRSRSYRQLLSDEMDSRYTAAAFMPLEAGQVLDFGTIIVLKQLSFGGLSAVYLVKEQGQTLRVLKESVVPTQSSLELKMNSHQLFSREVDLLKRIVHPNIVSVVRSFYQDDREYLLLEFIQGQTLEQIVREDGPRPELEVIRWGLSIAETLEYLHGMEPPILHRELTPANIILRKQNELVIADFGVAHEFLSSVTATRVGNHCYMSPEQFRGQSSIANDIYSLGGTLHYLITGHVPVPLSQSIPRSLDSTVSEPLSKIVEDMTSLDPRQRIPSTKVLIERLNGLRST